MPHPRMTRLRQPSPLHGPGIADAIPPRGAHSGRSNPLDVAPGQHEEFLTKRRFVEALLVANGMPGASEDAASAWVLAFVDDADPTGAVHQWLRAGWVDPLLVHAALRVCGNRARAERCMVRLGRDLGSRYEHRLVTELVEAMVAIGNVETDS